MVCTAPLALTNHGACLNVEGGTLTPIFALYVIFHKENYIKVKATWIGCRGFTPMLMIMIRDHQTVKDC